MSLSNETRWLDVTESWKTSAGPTNKVYWSLQKQAQGAPSRSDLLGQRGGWGWQRTNIHVEWFPKLGCWRVIRTDELKRGHELVKQPVYLSRFDGREKLDDAKHFAEATYMLSLPCQ